MPRTNKEHRDDLMQARRYLRSAIKLIRGVYDERPYTLSVSEAIGTGNRTEDWLNEAIDLPELEQENATTGDPIVKQITDKLYGGDRD